VIPQYRFYRVKKDGHIVQPPAVHEYARDDEALKEAKQRLNGHNIEIWQDKRLVAYLVPPEK